MPSPRRSRLWSGLLTALLLLTSSSRAAEETLETAFAGHTLAINRQDQRLGAAQWADPERNWRTLGELLKTALPPADAAGRRPNVTLSVRLDATAPWGGLQCLCMAASALGLSRAKVALPVRPREDLVLLALPGADPAQGAVVRLPLFPGGPTGVQTENAGQRVTCNAQVLQGLVKQLPQATVHVQAPVAMPAYLVVAVLRDLRAAGAAQVAFLPLKAVTAAEEAERKEAKEAVDRSLRGGLGGLGK